jgi:hypothetical protein
MNPQQSLVRGRWLVLGVIALLLGIAIWTTVHYLMVRGTDRLVVQSVRFAVEVALLALLYRGHPWARWITVTIFGSAGILGAWNVAHRIHWTSVFVALAYLSCAMLLIVSPSVAIFLEEQERRRQDQE